MVNNPASNFGTTPAGGVYEGPPHSEPPEERLIRKIAEARHKSYRHAEAGIKPVGPMNGCNCWRDATIAVSVIESNFNLVNQVIR